MARLRIYRANGGGMLELVRYQKKEKAAGAEEVIYSSTQMLRMEKRSWEDWQTFRYTVFLIPKSKR